MTSIRTRLGVVAAGRVLAAGLVTTAADASAAVPACGKSSMSVTRTFVQGGAGHSCMSLVYRNRTAHTCTVRGYLGVEIVTKTGHVLADAKRTLSGYGAAGRCTPSPPRPGTTPWRASNPTRSAFSILRWRRRRPGAWVGWQDGAWTPNSSGSG